MKNTVLLFSFFLFLSPTFAASPNDNEIRTRVLSVYDGDTLTVEIDGQEEKIRIIGIDTPEIKKGSKKTCRGKTVANLAKSLLEGKEVLLLRDGKTENRDSFGRLLRYVKIREKLDYGFLMVLLGNAEIYEKEDFSKRDLYEKFQERAIKRKRGVWSEKCVAENASVNEVEENNSEEKTESGNTENIDSGSEVQREGDSVKRSKSGICHDENSQYFEQTKAYRWYPSIQKCIDSGGRLPQ